MSYAKPQKCLGFCDIRPDFGPYSHVAKESQPESADTLLTLCQLMLTWFSRLQMVNHLSTTDLA